MNVANVLVPAPEQENTHSGRAFLDSQLACDLAIQGKKFSGQAFRVCERMLAYENKRRHNGGMEDGLCRL
jgi:hypothetical protein